MNSPPEGVPEALLTAALGSAAIVITVIYALGAFLSLLGIRSSSKSKFGPRGLPARRLPGQRADEWESEG